MYKNIDEWFESLEIKTYEYELTNGQESITNYINDYIETHIATQENGWECIQEDISIEEFNQIAGGNLELLSIKMSDDCKLENKNISIENITNIQSHITDMQRIAQQQAEKKSNEIHQISRIWLYSDGITENSSFDLIDDLQAIDDIIFSQKIPYEGQEYEDLNEYLNENFWISENKGNETDFSIIDITKSENQEWSSLSHSWVFIDLGTTNTYSCNIGDEKTLLSTWSLQSVIDDLNNDSPDILSNSWIHEMSGQENQEPSIINTPNNYTALNDNWVWPCNNFFCITVEFIMYNHKLLWWGPDVSIEYLINRSNNHLKKFANSSLVQANMTNNNFELWLKDLNLPDLFSLNVQIQSKPVPILDIGLEEKEKNDKLTSTNMLEEYYKTHDLEFERRHDISIFTHKAQEKKSIIDNAELTNIEAVQEVSEYVDTLTKKSQQFEFNPLFVDKYITYNELERFSNQFRELERFANAIFEYSVSINSIIRKMNEIPLDKS